MVSDAPWIQDAELNGYPQNDPVKCPECGRECETIYVDRLSYRGTVFGCDKCLKGIDAYDWFKENKEEDRDD